MPSKFNPTPKDCLTYAQLSRELRYEPATGHLYWLRPLSRRKIDAQAGCLNHDGYRKIKMDGCVMQAHRVCWMLHFGRWPIGYLDHINGERDDNRIDNLREVSRCGNVQNRRIVKRGKRLPGVEFKSNQGKFQAHIQVNGKSVWLGTYDTEEAAHQVYLNAIMTHHTNNRLNDKGSQYRVVPLGYAVCPVDSDEVLATFPTRGLAKLCAEFL